MSEQFVQVKFSSQIAFVKLCQKFKSKYGRIPTLMELEVYFKEGGYDSNFFKDICKIVGGYGNDVVEAYSEYMDILMYYFDIEDDEDEDLVNEYNK